MVRRLNKAQKAEVDRIGRLCKGNLKAEVVVDESRNPESPLYKEFSWGDDEKMAYERRLDIARSIIRAYFVVVKPERRKPVRAWVSVKQPGYRRVDKVMSSKQLRAAHLETALCAAEEFAERYPELDEWEIIRSAILRAVAKVRGK